MTLDLPPSLRGIPRVFIVRREKTPWEPDRPNILYGINSIEDLARELKKWKRGQPPRNSREGMLARLRRIRK